MKCDASTATVTIWTLNESTWTMRVVPTLAPSMRARPGTRPTNPLVTKEVVIRLVAVLLCSTAVMPRPAKNALNLLRRA